MKSLIRVFLGAALVGLVSCLMARPALADDTPDPARGRTPSSPPHVDDGRSQSQPKADEEPPALGLLDAMRQGRCPSRPRAAVTGGSPSR